MRTPQRLRRNYHPVNNALESRIPVSSLALVSQVAMSSMNSPIVANALWQQHVNTKQSRSPSPEVKPDWLEQPMRQAAEFAVAPRGNPRNASGQVTNISRLLGKHTLPRQANANPSTLRTASLIVSADPRSASAARTSRISARLFKVDVSGKGPTASEPRNLGRLDAFPSSALPVDFSSQGSKIRPMTLASSHRPVDPDSTRSFRPIGVVHALGDMSGGSGGEAPNKSPVITASGGYSSQQKVVDGVPLEGQYEIPGGVPVGAVLTLIVSSPDAGYDIAAITWSGGTNVSGSFNGSPAEAPPPYQFVSHAVATDEITYRFIVDATPRQYSITSNVQYSNSASGTSTLTFDSVRPTTASLALDKSGTFKFTTAGPYGKVIIKTVDGGVRIKAETKTAAFGGDFMFIQIANLDRSHTPAGQNPVEVSGTDLIDDGIGETLSIAINLDEPDDPDTHYWHLDANSMTRTAYIKDPPGQSTSPTDTQLSVNDSFSTLLVYRPAGGVWIALEKFDWSFVATVTKTNNAWPADTSFPSGSMLPSTPGGGAEFPVWVNRTSDLPNTRLW